MKFGCGYPMGPFTLLDFVGLETTYYIANIMFDEFREKRFAPPPLLKRLVLAGHHGRKTWTRILRLFGPGESESAVLSGKEDYGQVAARSRISGRCVGGFAN